MVPMAPPAANVAQERAGTAPDIVKECDRLTVPPDPTAASAPAVAVKTDWNRAVVACEAALKAEPGEPHFHFALGKAYFFAKNYFEAARHLTVAADTLPEAQNALGFCFEKGLGVVKNDQRAFELYSKAAAAGSAVAMESLGGVYTSGTYVKQDFGKALDWLERSVEAGNSDSLQVIGNMYFNGQGVPKDYAMAAQYFQQAADLNNGYALRFLANMYEVGLLGPPNPEKQAPCGCGRSRSTPMGFGNLSRLHSFGGSPPRTRAIGKCTAPDRRGAMSSIAAFVSSVVVTGCGARA